MRLGEYEVVRPIATGGMGAVFEVSHLGTRARYAAKIVKDARDERARERFKREAQLLARVDRHPGIVKIHSFGETPEGSLYMVLDLVRGESLEAKLAREERLPARAAAKIARSVASALGAAHALGVVHRDVKPSNILIESSGEPRLTDFGIAAARDLERLTRTGAFVGTAAYASPEQVSGKPVTSASDVFSLGAVLHEMLAGRPPIVSSNPLQLFAELASDEPIPDVRALRPEVPAPLAAVLVRALEKDAARRYPDAATLAAELAAFLEGRPTTVETPRAGGRSLALGGALAAAVLGGFAFAAFVLGGESREGRDRARLAALETVARASPGASDALSLLAARGAIAVAAESSRAISWETCASGARAALALHDGASALELSGRALERAPAERREELALLHARARFEEGGAADALEELARLGSGEARRLRAHLLLTEGRFPELERLPGDDPFVAGARALARARRDGDVKRARREIDKASAGGAALDCALDLVAARAIIADLDELTHGEDPELIQLLSGEGDRLRKPLVQVRELLEAAHRAPRYVATPDVLAIADRSLFYIGRAYLAVAGGFTDEDTKLVLGFEKTVFLYAREDDVATGLIQARVEAMTGDIGDESQARRRRFLEGYLDRSSGELPSRLAQTIAALAMYRVLEDRWDPRAALARVERILGRLRDDGSTNERTTARGRVEDLAGELALREATVEPARGAQLLERAAAHLAAARKVVPEGTPDQGLTRNLACLSVELALARGDLDGADAELRSKDALDVRFLAGELLRLRGKPAEARPVLEQAEQEIFSPDADVRKAFFRGDVAIALALVDVAQRRPGARERLGEVYGRREESPTVLPWIDRDARKALGE